METTNTGNGFRSFEDVFREQGINPGEPGTPPTPPVTPPVEPAPEPAPPAPQSGEPTPPAEPPVPAPSFEINDFNQRFSTQLQSEDDIRSLISSSQRAAELEAKVKELESLREENLLLRENVDPMKHFASEDEYRIAQFRKQFPDKDAITAYRLMGADVSQMKDDDVLTYEIMLETPGIDEATARELVNDKYGIVPGDQLDRLAEAKIKVDATKARKSFSSLKEQIKLPEKVSADSILSQQKELQEKKKAQLTEGWQKVVSETAKTMKDVVLTDTVNGETKELFRYSVGNDIPPSIVESVVNSLASAGVDITKDTAVAAAEALRREWIYSNHEKILKAAVDNALAKAEERRLLEQHQPGSPKPGTPPNAPTTDFNDTVLQRVGVFQPRPFFNNK